ncbi:MAG: protein adenylyltransferase SelO family protein, partial [Leptospiraceae bacterium]|nr:protein adenylyltransferase SelO family protein [Leptospiraceae bacterium]
MQATTSIRGWKLQSSYARHLPEVFYSRVGPARFAAPQLVIFNYDLAAALGLDCHAASDEELALLFSGQNLPPAAEPIAQAYAGHQFGHFTMLGDGRALV